MNPTQLTLPLHPPPLSPGVRSELEARVPRDWQADAACRGSDPGLFDADETTASDAASIGAAKAVCRRCPVRGACLAAALLGDETGVWGATTDVERDQLRVELVEYSERRLAA